MDRKKLLGAVVASLTAFTISATALAALNETSARELAAKWVPEQASHVSTKSDQLEYEVVFFNKATAVKYEIEINKLTEKVTEVKTKLQSNRGSQIIHLSEDEVKNIVLSEFPNAAIQKIKLEADDGYQHYEVKFTAGNVRGEMEINPETGVIIERELHY